MAGEITRVTSYRENSRVLGLPHGWVVKFAHSTSAAPGSWVRTWHRSSGHVEVASHMPQLEGPTTMYWGDLGRKSRKKKPFRVWSSHKDLKLESLQLGRPGEGPWDSADQRRFCRVPAALEEGRAWFAHAAGAVRGRSRVSCCWRTVFLWVQSPDAQTCRGRAPTIQNALRRTLRTFQRMILPYKLKMLS